jgi:hypothetical protein
MRHTKKGNQFYFGMKCHVGIDTTWSVDGDICSSTQSLVDGDYSRVLPIGCKFLRIQKKMGDE